MQALRLVWWALQSLDVLFPLLLVVASPVGVAVALVGWLRPSFRLAAAAFVVGNAILVFFAYRWYESLVRACDGSPEVAAGGDRFSCYEPYNWWWIDAVALFFVMLELALLVVPVGAAVIGWRRRASPPVPPSATMHG